VRSVQAMNGLDATFLYFETPSMHMHVVGVLLLDPSDVPGGWNRRRVPDLIRSRIDLIPPFRRKLVPSTLRLHHPVWVDVAGLDVEDHIEQVTCPAPGAQTQLEELVAAFASEQLDRSRPLWRILVVDGLEDGRVAVVVKVHHCAVDGVGAAKVLAALFDLDQAGRTPEQLADARALAELNAAPDPGLAGVVLHSATGLALKPWQIARLVPTVARSAVSLVRSRQEKSGEGQAGAVPFTAPRAPFNGRISPQRAVSFADIALDDVKAVKKAVGGTFNDAIIAICGGAFRHYLLERDALPDTSLIAVIPVSVRDEDDVTAANRTSAMFTTLATDVADPLERLEVVRQANLVGKADHEAVGGQLLFQAAEIAPPNTTSLIARIYSAARLADVHPVVHNVVISNVAGPPIQIFRAGARLEGVYPLGPVLEGPGLNVTIVSYRDRVGFGLIACRQQMPDVAALAAAVPHALAELLEAAGATA
jgi:WS/DGAT/MGAT family acyltransferase